jgi:hypothetical protein
VIFFLFLGGWLHSATVASRAAVPKKSRPTERQLNARRGR